MLSFKLQEESQVFILLCFRTYKKKYTGQDINEDGGVKDLQIFSPP